MMSRLIRCLLALCIGAPALADSTTRSSWSAHDHRAV
jgi:hypothetical protein